MGDEQQAKKAGEGKSMHHGGSHRSYMQNKNAKLQEQFEGLAEDAKRTDIFSTVSVYVNGFTNPSHQELKHLMALHGGSFQNYFFRSTVTHVICAGLPDAKLKQLERERDPTPVVRPEWVVDSVQAGKLLPISEYALWQLGGPPGQRTLKAFAAAGQAAAGAKQAQSAAGTNAAASSERQGEPAASPAPHAYPASSHYDPVELALARRTAARMRSECDVLQAPPRSTKDDPNFMDTYFRASRLHFIGTWKARLEALMASATASQAPQPAPWMFGRPRDILHLDMDCFFASVAEAGREEFRGKPIVVSHSNSARSSGEVSSANYEARRFGVGAMMTIARAKELCPALVVVPYEFDKYAAVSEQVYKILLTYTAAVQPISCDEAFLDVTGLGQPAELAAAIRADIFEATKCTASAGIGPNMILARIATKQAKPNGQFMLTAASAAAFLADLPVCELPGVGWSTRRKLEEMGVHAVRDVLARSKEALQAGLGAKGGVVLWDFAHGRDERRVEPPRSRKSVGAEVNWGVRFDAEGEPGVFLERLAGEVAERMRAAGVKGRTITLKVKRRKEGWQEPSKFLGMGACDSLSRSVTLPRFTDSKEEVGRQAGALLRALNIPHEDIRGLGLQVGRLDNDPGSTAARPNAAPPAKAAAPPASKFEPHALHPWGGFFKPQRKLSAGEGSAQQTSHDADYGGNGEEASDAGFATDSDQREGTLGTTTGAANVAQQVQQARQPNRGGGTKRKSPGKTQATLLASMHCPAAAPAAVAVAAPAAADHGAVAGDGGEEEESALADAARRRLMEQYMGSTLTQVDAAEFAALPWQVQKALIDTLPNSRGPAGRHKDGIQPVAGNAGTADVGRQGGDACSAPSSPAPPAFPLEAAAVRQAPGGEGRSDSLIAALPPSYNEVDPAVLAPLPAELRREVEAAYGRPPAILRPAAGQPKRGRGGGGRGAARHAPPKPVGKRQLLDSFLANPPPYGAAPRRADPAAASYTISQLDPEALGALPAEMRREVLAQAALHSGPGAASSVRSRPGAGVGGAAVAARAAEARAAWERQRLKEMRAEQLEDSCDDGRDDPDGAGNDVNVDVAALPPSVAAFVQAAYAAASSGGPPLLVLAGQLEQCVAKLQAEVEQEARAGSLQSPSPFAGMSSEVLPQQQRWRQPQEHECCDIPPTQLQQPTSTPPCHSPAKPCGTPPLGWRGGSRQLHAALAALEAALVAATKPLAAADLEQARAVLLLLQAVGARYACFADVAFRVTERVQQRVRRCYGWPLSLRRLLA